MNRTVNAPRTVSQVTDCSTDEFEREFKQRWEQTLAAIAQLDIYLTEAGLWLTLPGLNTWTPDDSYAKAFADLPDAFAQSFLQLRVRNFLLETFCQQTEDASEKGHEEAPNEVSQPVSELSTAPLDAQLFNEQAQNSSPLHSSPLLANNQLGGGLHAQLIQLFDNNNHATGYYEPDWQLIEVAADGSLAVQKDGITVYARRDRHLRASQQTAQPGDRIDILLPGYRYDTDYYIAISNLGPVEVSAKDDENAVADDAAEIDAVEIYFAANAAAMGLIMTAVTASLSDRIPYTLRVPHRLSGYWGPEAIALRIRAIDCSTTYPVLQQIARDCGVSTSTNQAFTFPAETATALEASPALRAQTPLFARKLWPGISWATVLKSPVTQWFGSSAEVSRMQLIAEALVTHWHAVQTGESAAKEKLSAIRSSLRAAGISESLPYRHLHTDDSFAFLQAASEVVEPVSSVL